MSRRAPRVGVRRDVGSPAGPLWAAPTEAIATLGADTLDTADH
jgi:hypothetical protein